MSLTAQKDTFALSLGVELADDGSIIDSSIIVTPSIVNVDYRLTYHDVDEMLADGIAHREEWQLGALFDAAIKRRKYRIRNGSSEGFVPKQIPQYTISAFRDHRQPDGIGISISVDVSHNGGLNQSVVVEDAAQEQLECDSPVSSASVLVTGKSKLGSCLKSIQ
jgi:exoribonuclease R